MFFVLIFMSFSHMIALLHVQYTLSRAEVRFQKRRRKGIIPSPPHAHSTHRVNDLAGKFVHAWASVSPTNASFDKGPIAATVSGLSGE